MSFTTIEQAKRQADERKKKHNPPAIEQSLRDYFAAKAMQSFAVHEATMQWSNDRLAAEAYDLADAMLKAREQ